MATGIFQVCSMRDPLGKNQTTSSMRNTKTVKHKFIGRNLGNFHHPLLAASVMVCAGINCAQAADSIPVAVAPPAFTTLTYDEDYSYLKDPAARTNLFDPIKYILLNK